MIRLLLPLLLLRVPASPLFPAQALAAEQQRIRVAITRGSASLKIRTSAKLYILEVKTGDKYQLLGDSDYEVRSSGNSIMVAGQQLSSPVKLLAADGGERIRLGGRLYKGDIIIRASGDDRIDIIEALSIEDYLCGVLPAEMSPDWPLEALKAQAVASRTYALKQLKPSADYDITDGVEMQVYKGYSGINSRIKEAVDSTRGEVLRYKRKLVTAFFHSCCGGHTASVNSAWGEEVIKPLYGVADPFCSASRHSKWDYFVPAKDLLAFIQKRGSMALKVTGLKPLKKDRSGRTLSYKISTDRGSETALTKEMRAHFGSYEFRSTFITRVTPVNGGYEFRGRGWGHGVGMCQEGAKTMANKGRGYRKILRYYYPGASIEDL
ncbi:MAG TPA: hypothetical protein DCZ92_13320 [Elusimicrobia bacterium]|nr:MAG: hypothetical protein A2016_02110 [Elusimicrobia bacterium GWF2_62_30]HBA61762.1 hypothetical protein [Elusimicrobiota bacterium]